MERAIANESVINQRKETRVKEDLREPCTAWKLGSLKTHESIYWITNSFLNPHIILDPVVLETPDLCKQH